MDPQLKDFFGAAKAVRLSADERHAMRSELLRKIQPDGVRPATAGRLQGQLMEHDKNPFAGSDKFSLSSEEKRKMSEDIQSFMRKHPVAKKAMEADLELTEECRAFFAVARRVGMTEQEQELVGDAVRSYAGLTPLRGGSVAEAEGPAMGILSWLTSGLLLRTGVAFVFSLFIVGAGGVVSYAAESSLPGDFLYPVKVGITESIQGRFLATEQDRVRWEAHRASRRLTEAEQLAAESRLDAASSEQLRENLSRHLDDAKRGLERLAQDDAASAAALTSSFEVSLKAHLHVLSDIDAGQAANVEQMLAIARSAASEAAEARTRAEQAASSSLDDGTLRAQAAAAVRSARERIEVVRGAVTARDAATGARSVGVLEAAASALTEAEAALESDPVHAHSMAKAAARLADEADALLVVRGRIHVASSAAAASQPAASGDSSVAAVSSSSEDAGSTGSAFQALNAAESAIESARGYLTSVQDRLSPSAIAEAGEQLNVATSSLAAARASLTVRAFADVERQARAAEAAAENARRLAQEALRSAISERGENSSVSSPQATSSEGIVPEVELPL